MVRSVKVPNQTKVNKGIYTSMIKNEIKEVNMTARLIDRMTF